MSTNNSPVEVVLVEDNPLDVELAQEAFRKAHIANSVRVLRDGAEALDYLLPPPAAGMEPAPPRVILLDLKLPRVDGLEVLRRLKSDERTRRVPVVVMTSSREERDVVTSYNLGANSYIVKPLDFEQFAEVVRQMGLYWLLLNHPATG